MAVFVVFLVSTFLIFVHLCWAMIDPHNVGARPRWYINLIKSAVISLLLLMAPAMADKEVSSVVFAAAFGAVVSPAINSPHVTPTEVEPIWYKRKARDLQIWAHGALLKTVIAIPITAAVAYVGLPHPWFVSLSALAILLDFSKTFEVIKYVRNSKFEANRFDRLLDVRLAVAVPRVMTLSFAGVGALSIWLYLVYMGPFALEKATLHDWLHAVAGLLAALIIVVT